MKQRKLAIWGWWQGHNLGDNWIKKTLMENFPYASFIDTHTRRINKYDFVICGGGGLFVLDVHGTWKKIHNLQFGMLGLGAEFEHKSRKAVELYEKSKFFYVRDEYSLKCMHLDGVERSYDLTFVKPLEWVEKVQNPKERLFFVWRDGKEWYDNSQFYQYIAPGSSYDEWKALVSKLFENIVDDDFQTTGDDIEHRTEGMTFVVSGRYHGIVSAIQRGLPFLAIDICPKIRALTKECGLEKYCIKISEIEKAEELIQDACRNVDEIRQKEWEFRNKAHEVIKAQVENAKLEVLKVIEPLNAIQYETDFIKKNFVVNCKADALSHVFKLKKLIVRTQERNVGKDIVGKELSSAGMIYRLNHKKVVRDVKKYGAKVVAFSSHCFSLDEKTKDYLSKNNIIVADLTLPLEKNTTLKYETEWNNMARDIYKRELPV